MRDSETKRADRDFAFGVLAYLVICGVIAFFWVVRK